MQGGHNEMIAQNFHKSLSDAGRRRLHYFWYVAKDQTAPLTQRLKRRSCHIKLMIADEHIGIVGNGNQDTQSWFQSQEINVMLDSPDVCRAWIDALRRNQNTHLYGALDEEDGVWRDADGKEPEGAMGADPGRFSWAKGLIGAVKRVQGTGGF
jgi:phosphatidylserine/phosphatidylglycerophosphate/cardiolipin synthase-like enzyme